MIPLEPEQPLTEADKLLLICFIDDILVTSIDTILQTSELRLLFRIRCITPSQILTDSDAITRTIAHATDPRRRTQKMVILLKFSPFPDALMNELAQFFFKTTQGILPHHHVIHVSPDMDDQSLINAVNRSIFSAFDHHELP